MKHLKDLKLNPRNLSLFLAVCLFFGLSLWLVRKNEAESPKPVVEGLATTEAVAYRPAPQSQATSSADSGELVVHVAGAVIKPGLVTLPQGSRVGDAITQVGGMTTGADAVLVEKSLNLAEKLQDGDKIYIPVPGEDLTAVPFLTSSTTSGSGTTSSSGSKATQSGSVNLNTASAEVIAGAGLYRIGPKTAEKIVSYRNQFGPFKTLEDLLAVPGIGEAILEGIRGSVSL